MTPIEQLRDDFHNFVHDRFEPIEKQVLQWTGGVKLLLGFATVASVVGVFFSVLAYFSEHH